MLSLQLLNNKNPSYCWSSSHYDTWQLSCP